MLKDYDYYDLYEDVCDILVELKKDYFNQKNEKLKKIIEIFKDDLNNEEIWEDEDITDVLANVLNILGEREFVTSVCNKNGLDEEETENIIWYSNDRNNKEDVLKCVSYYVKRTYELYEHWNERYGENEEDSYSDPYKEIGMSRSDFF